MKTLRSQHVPDFFVEDGMTSGRISTQAPLSLNQMMLTPDGGETAGEGCISWREIVAENDVARQHPMGREPEKWWPAILHLCRRRF